MNYVYDNIMKDKENTKYYIYFHLDPRDSVSLPRYVGKGKGDRAWDFYGRNKKHKAWVKELKELGLEPLVMIGKVFESEKEVYEVEKTEVDLFKRINGEKILNIAPGGLHQSPSDFTKKPIICLTTGKQYSSTKEAADDLKMLPKRINDVLKGRKKSYGGYKFRYIDESLNIEPDEERERKAFARRHTTAKSIICNETGQIYISITQAANELGINNSTICSHLSGKLKHVRGFTFRRL
jgi:hypothetical protein